MKQLFLLPLAALTTVEVEAAVKEQPNIIFILADDMGIGDLGCYGQDRIPTPNIDMLAQRGIRFTHHYSGSTVSAPSRCALMTGKHTGHGFVRGNKGEKSDLGTFDIAIPSDEVTVAEVAKSKGYVTMCVGKWGLGGPKTEGSPVNQGYDYFYGYLSQGHAHSYYPDYLWENESRVELDGETYSHYLMMERGLAFMAENIDKPIFAYFALTPPHADLDNPDISAFKGRFEETPYVNNNKIGGYKSNDYPRATYAAMVASIDRSVGDIVELLEREGRLDNSIIIFSSDNGVHGVGGHDPEFFNSNLEFRGIKRDLYEGGIRTPFVVSWPESIAQGVVSDHISTFWDFLPTVCDIVGAKSPEGVDGISYLPTLLGKGKQAQHKNIYFEFFEQGGKQCVIEDGWKLVRLNISKPNKTYEELYNLNVDPSELHNMIESQSERAEYLRCVMDASRSESDEFKFVK
ncbi:MAG: arylsulfatase [Rikenellaceae bacterium]